ncbi:MAG: histidinol-phosphate transaminase [Lachnospiraceae bacterium]|nr:histidinol-phosphate transaminase [Lachnospiraceae bacterium]
MRAWEKNIRKVVPYVPGEQPKVTDVIKLNTNENPYPPAPGVEEALKGMDADRLRLYPDPTAEALVEAIAKNYGLDKEQVFVGVGSDDVLAMAFLTFFNSDKPILFPDITYSFYDVWADLFQIPYERIELDDNFCIRVRDYDKENGGVVLANPNAPTGEAVNLAFIEDLLQHNQDVIVIVDEAYVDFGTKSALSLIDKYENLLVVQTFSKSRSMAGIRIGYAMGHRDLIKAINDVKYSFNSYTMNMPSIVLGVKAVEDKEYFEKTTAKIIATRERAKEEFRKLGFQFGDSKSNFIFVTHPKYSANEIFEYLKTKKIYVRHFSAARINNYLRVTVGTDEQMEAVFAALREYMKQE